MLGFEKGNLSAHELLTTVNERAKEIAASGGFTNEEALRKILKMQAESMVDNDGEFPVYSSTPLLISIP